MFRVLSAAGLLVCATSAAFADGHAVAARAGALGLGIEYTYALNDRVAFRAGLNGSELGFDAEESGIDYEFDFVWDSLSVAVDFHPLRSALRLTAGVLRNDNRLDAESRPSGDVTVGGTTYAPAEIGTLYGVAGFDDTTPFVGIGWDWSRSKRRFGMSFDVGVLDQGPPSVALTVAGPLLGDTAFESDIRAEEAQLRDSLADLDVIPYASLGFVFRL